MPEGGLPILGIIIAIITVAVGNPPHSYLDAIRNSMQKPIEGEVIFHFLLSISRLKKL